MGEKERESRRVLMISTSVRDSAHAHSEGGAGEGRALRGRGGGR